MLRLLLRWNRRKPRQRPPSNGWEAFGPWFMLHQPALSVLVPLLCGLCLTGCARARMTASPRLPIPPSLLQCQAQPVPADLKTDTDLADWVLDLAAAGQDCRTRLRAVAGIEGGGK